MIEEQLETAQAVLVLWSKEAVASQWVRSEANRGREKDRLVQVRLDDARLPMPFDQVQCADLSGWDGNPDAPAWRSVVGSIADLANRDVSEEVVRSSASPAPDAKVQRRNFLVAGGAVGIAAAAGFAGWRYFEQPRISPQAQLLIQKGMDALQQNDALETQDPGSTLSAIALLTDATEAAPESSLAWGGLAMAYAVRKRIVPVAERPGLDARSRAAAKRALEIDPSEGRALGAVRMLDPTYRNWIEAERADREAVNQSPQFPILLFILSDMLGSVGRWKEARRFSDRLDRKKFLLPGADRKVIVNLWAAGDLPAADAALENAVNQWPQHPQIFRTRLAYLMYSGRPEEVLDLLQRPRDLPIEIKDDYVEAVRSVAEALASRRPSTQAVSAVLKYLGDNPTSALQAAQACVALNNAPTAYAIFSGYFFGEGEWSKLAPLGGDQDRVTSPLFQPPMRSIWREVEFERLLERIGLSAYWRESGTVPDFRRGS